MSLADLQITNLGNGVVAHLSGEIDMSNAEDVGTTVIGATPNEVQGVVLDLSDVEYMDSAGIYVIFGMRTSLQARGQSLVLVIPPGSPVLDALRLSGVDPGDVAESVEDAVRALDGVDPLAS